jgi:hypothetical protein
MARSSNFFREIVASVMAEHAATRPPTEPDPWRICPFAAHGNDSRPTSCRDCMDGRCARFEELGLDDSGCPLPKAERPRCGAKTRSGKPCQARVVPGKRRCRMHGGLSTGPRTAEGRSRIAAAQRMRWAKERVQGTRAELARSRPPDRDGARQHGTRPSLTKTQSATRSDSSAHVRT